MGETKDNKRDCHILTHIYGNEILLNVPLFQMTQQIFGQIRTNYINREISRLTFTVILLNQSIASHQIT